MVAMLGIAGFFAGALGGLLGIGGGILLMPLLRFGFDLSPAAAAGTCVVAVLFTTLGGSFKHYRLGHIELKAILPVMAAGLISSLLFSALFVFVSGKGKWLDFGTGVVFCAVALRMLWEGAVEWRCIRKTDPAGKAVGGSISAKIAIGGMAGILPGLLGIGTGAVLVPAFAIALRAPIKIAIGSSLACFSLNALASSACKALQGHVEFSFLPLLCLGTVVGARFGATLNGRFSSPLLKLMFGSFFVYVASKYVAVFFGH
ncbi:MAG: sulfite exporter TauE/SafE family protein [Desulfobacterales bacterium]|nr:sulfite exporter TauE/SafE family protein [Desulfobacterales bacterium]